MAASDAETPSPNPDVHAQVDVNNVHLYDETYNSDLSLEQSRWWFLSTAFPMIAGTLGPVASAFSICSLVEPWRQKLIPGENVQEAISVPDPTWLLIIEAIQLFVGITSNLFLLLNMGRRIRFSPALPITIIGWYASSLCRTILSITAARPFKAKGYSEEEIIWSQSFYYGMWAAILFFIDASLLAVTFWGACAGHYPKDLLLTTSQRTLMLQSILLLVYFLLGAYMFSEIENWQYLDAVYWAVVTLFTVGFGDFYPATDLGRALLIPFALAGIISLGLVISSVRNLIIENGSRCVTVRIGHKRRDKIIRKTLLRGDINALEPIHEKPQILPTRTIDPQRSEFERRKAEFYLMREIQAKSATQRKWVAMAISTFSWLVLWLLGALVFQKAEHAYQDWSYFDAVYFCFEAWTTLGYGDLSPVSNAGRSFYVFWSLLALPTMTVLISNASGTVVRIIRDVIIFVGDVTILPNGRGLIRNAKGLFSKITLSKVLPDQDLETSIRTTESTSIDKRSAGTTTESHGTLLHQNIRGVVGASGSEKLASTMRSLQNADVRSISTPELHNLNSRSTAAGLQLLLLAEIRTVTIHLKESEPHHYNYDQWVWYLKLIGEDEHNPQTHCRVEVESAQETVHRDGSDGGQKWSWIGNRSPLLSTQQESEWILDRLMDRLQESLLTVRT